MNRILVPGGADFVGREVVKDAVRAFFQKREMTVSLASEAART
jgi:hypothetical protein